jgi:pimeloyl-ACP methyl ester carboxylesterase
MWWIWLIIALLVILLSGVAVMLIKTVPIAKRVYKEQLVKTDKEKWGRVCSCLENEEQVAMWESGLLWSDKNKDKMEEVHIVNDGLNLYGEFYRFNDGGKCVIILPGRCECLKYSYYFALPYQNAGFNVLVIDSRAHGLSDGIYNTIGMKEGKDLLCWTNFIIEKFGINEIYYHGICVGTASCLVAMTDKECPKEVKGLVTEGCFTSFKETFLRHMKELGRPTFPVLNLVMHFIKKYAGADYRKVAPIKLFKKVNQRVLFLYGEKDVFSVPEKSKELFAATASAHKQLKWFSKGGHSHLRINNTEEYDNTIIEFLKAD